MTDHPPPWLSPQDLADELGVPVSTVYGWRHTGAGPVGHKVGRHVRFRRSDVEAWLGTCREEVAS